MKAPMTKNDAYKYARVWYRKKHGYGRGSYIELEAAMRAEEYSEEDIRLVKDWLGAWGSGRAY